MNKLIAFAFLFVSCTAYSQPKLSSTKPAPSIRSFIETVAKDYYQNFDNVKGDTLSQTPGAIEFKSQIIPSGALSTSITKYVNPYSYTWQAIMFESEDYETAIAKYKEYYRQLNNCTLTFYDKSSYKLSGLYDIPDESRPFASSILKLNGKNHDLELFKVEVAINYSMPNWTVKIMVYEKVADNEIRPTIH